MTACFFFNDAATPEIYTLSLHDALPILCRWSTILIAGASAPYLRIKSVQQECRDRKSGSAGMPRPISYAVFCLKKKNQSADVLAICVLTELLAVGKCGD